MIELPVQGLKRCLKVGEIANPADGFVYLSADVNLDAKGMTMQSGAPVRGGYVRQAVRCFEAKLFKYLHPASVPISPSDSSLRERVWHGKLEGWLNAELSSY
jgi:hypothetical protein